MARSCPDYRGSTVQECFLWPDCVLIIEVPLYRSVYCGPKGVLIIEVPLYV